jgi:hypothetical protein
MSTELLLPPEFADLEHFAADWVLATPTLEDRLRKRRVTPMDELHAFYDTVFPRAEAAMAYLDQFDVNDVPETARNLMVLLYSLSVVSVATEVFNNQRDPNAGTTWIKEVSEPAF